MEKLNKFLKSYQSDIVLALAVVLISVTAFNLGKLSVANDKKFPVSITEPNRLEGPEGQQPAVSSQKPVATSVVASKASKSKLYHFPWCSGASRISEKNKMTFPTEAAALAAGYTLAGNCGK